MACPTLRFQSTDDISMWSLDGGPLTVGSEAVLWARVYNLGDNGPARMGSVQFAWQQPLIAGGAIMPIAVGDTVNAVNYGSHTDVVATWRPTTAGRGTLWGTAWTQSIPTFCPANTPPPQNYSVYSVHVRSPPISNLAGQPAVVTNPFGLVVGFAIAKGEGTVTVSAESLGLRGLEQAETFLSVADARYGTKAFGVLSAEHASLIERHQSERQPSALKVELDPNRELQGLLSVSFPKLPGERLARCLTQVRVTSAVGPPVGNFVIGLQTDAKNPVWL